MIFYTGGDTSEKKVAASDKNPIKFHELDSTPGDTSKRTVDHDVEDSESSVHSDSIDANSSDPHNEEDLTFFKLVMSMNNVGYPCITGRTKQTEDSKFKEIVLSNSTVLVPNDQDANGHDLSKLHVSVGDPCVIEHSEPLVSYKVRESDIATLSGQQD